jgi:RNA polymerase sigma-70 factor (ECF subfamily)
VNANELGEWITRIGPALVLYARQWCDCPEDVVQEAFVRLAGANPRHVPAWLHRVVRNAALDAARAARRRKERESQAARPYFVASESDEAAEVLEVALRRLPAELRETVVAHLWGGLPFSEIGLLMGTSPATAHRRYQEALELLRPFLEPS